MRKQWSKLLVFIPLVTIAYSLIFNHTLAQNQREPGPNGTERQQLNQLLGKVDPLFDQETSPMPIKPFSSNNSTLDTTRFSDPFFQQFFRQQNIPLPESFSEIANKMQDSFQKFEQSISEATPVVVSETPKDYVLTISIQRPEDAKNIVVDVQPHFISIHGALHQGEMGSQTFMKSFTTRTAVDPKRVLRKLTNQNKQLVVVVPKLSGDKPDAVEAPIDSPKKTPSQPVELPNVQVDSSVI